MTRDDRDRDPAPTEPWRPVSSEWARRQAKEACEAAVRAAKDRRTTVNREAADNVTIQPDPFGGAA